MRTNHHLGGETAQGACHGTKISWVARDTNPCIYYLTRQRGSTISAPITNAAVLRVFRVPYNTFYLLNRMYHVPGTLPVGRTTLRSLTTSQSCRHSEIFSKYLEINVPSSSYKFVAQEVSDSHRLTRSGSNCTTPYIGTNTHTVTTLPKALFYFILF